jgi:hypothetical protein
MVRTLTFDECKFMLMSACDCIGTRGGSDLPPIPCTLYVANCLADEQILPSSKENGEPLLCLGE